MQPPLTLCELDDQRRNASANISSLVCINPQKRGARGEKEPNNVGRENPLGKMDSAAQRATY
jgi:hypothetical protein